MDTNAASNNNGLLRTMLLPRLYAPYVVVVVSTPGISYVNVMGSKKAAAIVVARAMDGRLMRHVSAQVVTIDKILLLSVTILFACCLRDDGFAYGFFALRRSSSKLLSLDDIGALLILLILGSNDDDDEPPILMGDVLRSN